MGKMIQVTLVLASVFVVSAAAQTSQFSVSIVDSDTFEGGKVTVDLLAKVTGISPSTLGSATIDLDYSGVYFTFDGVVGSDIDPSSDGYTYSATALEGDPLTGVGDGAYVRLSISGTDVGPGFGLGSGFDVPQAYANLGRLEFTITAEGAAAATDLDFFIRTGSLSFGHFENAGNDPANGVIRESSVSEILDANDIALASDELALEFDGEYLFDPPYPNPFNALAQFDLAIREPQNVVIEVYDAVGRRVGQIHDGLLAPNQRILFSLDGSRLGSGLYHVRARGETFSAVRSVVLVR